MWVDLDRMVVSAMGTWFSVRELVVLAMGWWFRPWVGGFSLVLVVFVVRGGSFGGIW